MEPSEDRRAGTLLAPHRSQTLAIGFACNNHCRTCLVADLRNTAPKMGLLDFRAHVDANGELQRFERLILSGGEVTLDEAFLDCARYARERGRFHHIRVQSNGRRFADPEFLRASIAAGVDEYFISVRAHDAALDESIAGDPRSFRETSEGLANIARSSATLITNTPVSRLNVEHLVPIVDFALGFGPSRMELYGFVPTTRAHRALMVPARALQHHVQRALERIGLNGPEVGISWMPRCLLGSHENLFVPEMPETVIGSDFWRAFPEFTCLFERVCEHHPACQGFPIPYVEEHGYERELLRPRLRSGQARRPAKAARAKRFGADAWMDLLRGPDGQPMSVTCYYAVSGVEAFADHVVLHFRLPEGPSLDVVIRERDDSRPRHAQTHSFNVSVHPTDPDGAPRQLVNRFTATLGAVLARNDDGHLAFAEQEQP
jgi:hypothetical protein